jgi:hypothetical protein
MHHHRNDGGAWQDWTMQAWLKNFPRIDENVNRLGYWVSFFGLVSAAMSWAAGYVTPLAQYGWGTAVYVGVGAACLIFLALTASLALWRRFYPLTVSSADLTTAELSKAAANAIDDNGQIEAIKAIISTLEGKTEDISNRLAEAERGIAQNKAGLDELRTKLGMLARSLRARDAQSTIKEADQVVMSTYKKMLEYAYPDEAAWANDYAAWEKAMSRIDNLMSQWTQQHHEPFLDIRLKETSVPPSQHIKSDANATRYKTAWLAQSSYASRRDGLFSYFAAIVGDV